MTIDITDYNRAGEYVEVTYFLNSESCERVLDINFESLVEHVEYEGMNEGSDFGQDHENEPTEKEWNVDSAIYTNDNLKLVLESYLKAHHKGQHKEY